MEIEVNSNKIERDLKRERKNSYVKTISTKHISRTSGEEHGLETQIVLNPPVKLTSDGEGTVTSTSVTDKRKPKT